MFLIKIVTSTGEAQTHLHIAFSVIQFYVGGIKKTGVCTGWLEHVTTKLRSSKDTSATALCDQVSALSLSSEERPSIKVSIVWG